MMCDLCLPGDPGDHDKPYVFGQRIAMRLRFTGPQWVTLIALKRHVSDVQQGYSAGVAFGDVSTDDPECPACHLPLHIHEPMRLCSAT